MKTAGVPVDTGYAGNLTADQETKLRQLWGLLLETFGFDATQHTAAGAQDPAAPGPGAPPDGTPSDHQVDMGQRALNLSAAAELRGTWLGMLKQENPDALLLRFLRARKWDVAQAFAMLRGALVWRGREVRVDEEVLRKGEPWCAEREQNGAGKEKKEAREFLDQLRLGKVYLRGRDRRGRPVGYVQVALHRPGMQSQETLEKLVVQTIETARCLFTPGHEAFCVVFDMTGFALSNMEWQPARFVIKAFEANYPECLGAMLIHNAPWVFSGVWKIIRGLLDPVVAAKVDFTRTTADLEKHIPLENIPSRFGGGDDWQYVYHEPSEDESAEIAQNAVREEIQAERRAIAERFLAATQAWIQGGETTETQPRKDAREALRANYWRLDPYVRSRTNLDRIGVIGRDGVVELYPDRKAAGLADEGKEGNVDS